MYNLKRSNLNSAEQFQIKFKSHALRDLFATCVFNERLLVVLQLHIAFKGNTPLQLECSSWTSLNSMVVMEWRPSDLPVWRWPAAHSSFPVAGWPCSAGYCSRRRWARGRALWWVAGGWNTGTAADTVSATHWAGGQTAQSPGTHTVTAHTHNQWDQSNSQL